MSFRLQLTEGSNCLLMYKCDHMNVKNKSFALSLILIESVNAFT